MKFLVICVFLVTAAHAAPSHGFVSPVILPKVHLASPDVTVVKQPYLIQQTEPVYRPVYYTDPLALSAAVPYVSSHPVAYHQHPSSIYHTAYAPAAAVNYVV